MSSEPNQQQPAIADEDVLSRTLVVRDLDYSMEARPLRCRLSVAGQVKSVFVIRGVNENDELKVTGYAEFETREAAEYVLQNFNKINKDAHFKPMLEWATFIPDKNSSGDYGIFVRDLSPNTTDQKLKWLFTTFYDSVKEAYVVIDELTGLSKGYGIVKFSDKFHYMRSLKEMHGMCYFNSEIPMQIEPIPKENP